jgi:hypothetical protein
VFVPAGEQPETGTGRTSGRPGLVKIQLSCPPCRVTQRAGIVRAFKRHGRPRTSAPGFGLLDPGATAIGDGGGLVSAGLRPIEGGEQVARYLVDIVGRAPGNV